MSHDREFESTCQAIRSVVSDALDDPENIVCYLKLIERYLLYHKESIAIECEV